MKTLVDGGIDWTVLVRHAIAHGLTPLLAWNLTRACAESLPIEIHDALCDNLTKNRERNLGLAREVLTIVDVLRTRDIPVIPIKGPVLAKSLYHDLGLRPSGDLDFLISKRHVFTALELLSGLGYELRQLLRKGQEVAYLRCYPGYDLYEKHKEISIDLQWSPAPHIMAVAFDVTGLWKRARVILFEGQQLLSLSPEDYLLFLSVHGSKHLWGRLNWICDIHEFVSTHAAINWACCLQRAREQGCERMLLLGLALAEGLLGTELPVLVRTWIQIDPKVLKLAQEIQADFFQDGARSPNVFEEFRPFLPLRERFRDKVTYSWRNMTTPRVNHLGIVVLPRTLWFLYIPIKLLYDYGWRLFRTPSKTAPGKEVRDN